MRLAAAPAPEGAEREALLDLWVAAWTAAMPALDFSARRPWLDGHLRALVEAGALLLLAWDEEEAPLGFATVHPGTGEVDQLAVGPGAQRAGVGRALLAEAMRHAPPGGLHLAVNQDNDRAVALYEQAGFVRTGGGVNPRSGLPVWTMRWRRRAC